MSDLTLYQIHDELEAWSNSLDLAESDDERAEIQARISEYLQMGRAKVDRFSAFLAHLEAQADLCRAEEKRIAARRRAIERVQEHLERYAISTMEQLGIRKMEGSTSSLALRQRPASVRILDEAAIPDAYKHATVHCAAEHLPILLEALPVDAWSVDTTDPDKDAIKRAIKSGVDVPGATLALGGNSLVRR